MILARRPDSLSESHIVRCHESGNRTRELGVIVPLARIVKSLRKFYFSMKLYAMEILSYRENRKIKAILY